MTKTHIPATGRYGIELPEVAEGTVSVWVEEDGSLTNIWRAKAARGEQALAAAPEARDAGLWEMAAHEFQRKRDLTQAWIDSREPDQPL